MHAKEIAQQTLDLSDHVTKAYLADLSDADLLIRPVAGMHHIAWQLGHLISVEHKVVEEIAPGASPALPEGFAARHGKEEAVSDDASRFYTKAEYLAAWDAQRAATTAALAGLSDDRLDAPGPEMLRRMVPTVGHTFNFLGTHVLMHVGQYVAVRRQLGKPIAI